MERGTLHLLNCLPLLEETNETDLTAVGLLQNRLIR